MKARYTEPISIKHARAFMQAYFGKPRIPHGSRCLWVAGVHEAVNQPGAYLISAAGGSCGVVVQPPAVALAGEGAA